ncbi:hypothetical protein X975_13874, partial [Stegodyphus mimosarum]
MWKLSLTLLLVLGLLEVNKACEEIIAECLNELEVDIESRSGLPTEDELRQ